MRRPRRPSLGAALALFVLVVLGATAWIGLRGLAAQRHLEDARVSLASARDALVDRDVAAARAAIDDAGADTARARALTSDPVWRLAGAVPGYGSTVRTVRGLAQAADDLAGEVLPQALDGAERIDPTRLRTPDGAVDLAVVRAATPPVRSSADDAARVAGDVEALPTQNVVRQVADARRELQEQVSQLADSLDGGAAALEVAPALLGEDRPRRYLMLVQQTSESRGTGGLPGGFVELVADAGRVSAVSSGSNRDLRNGEIPVPPGVPAGFIERYGGEFGAFRIWQNVNLSPDLPVVAKVVQARWQAQGGQPLDGVAMVDPQALATILGGTGPIALPDGRSVQPAELERYLAVDQYAGVPVTGDGQLARKDQLEDVAALVAARLTGGSGDTDTLLRGLVEAVRSGHLQLASDDAALQPTLAEHGVDGALPRGTAPVAYPVVYNDSEGKLDFFLDRSATYTAESCDGDQRRTEITVTLTNTAPAVQDLPPYLTIRNEAGRTVVSNVNRVTASVYGTRGAFLLGARLDGVVSQPQNPDGATVTVDEEAGMPVWSVVLDLPPGQPRTLALQVLEPAAAGAARVPEQPLARPLTASADVPEC
jgi:hypothetical protein